MNRSQYVPGLDLLRFFAACVVVFYHLAFWSWAFPQGQVARVSGGVADFHAWAEVTSGGWIGVQIFFVISGFVIALSAEHASAYKFAVSRFVRLVPAVWICATLSLIAWLFVDSENARGYFVAYLRSIVFAPTAPWIDIVHWTLGVEICFYALVFGLIVIRRFHWLKAVMCVIGLASAAYWIAFTVGHFGSRSSWHELLSSLQESRWAQLSLLHHGVFFAIGVLLWLRLTKRKTFDQWIWLLIFSIGACLQIAAEVSSHEQKTGLGFSAVGPCLVWAVSMLFLWAAVRWNDRVIQMSPAVLGALRRLGLMTYPLYLLHNVFGGALMGASVRSGLPTTAALWLTVACVVSLSWWVSVVPEPMLQRISRARFESLRTRVAALVHRKRVVEWGEM